MILHIASDSSKHIIYPFIDFVNQNFNKKEHFFILCSKQKEIQKFENSITKDIFEQEQYFIDKIQTADKIILHGIWYDKLCEILLKVNCFDKIYWQMWGGDFYFAKKHSELKKYCFKHIKHFIGSDFDMEYLQEMYKIDIKHKYYTFMYPSNMFKNIKTRYKKTKKTNILIGNSLDRSNNHLYILRKLKNQKNIQLFMPISYGDNEKYKKFIKIKAKNKFKDKVIFLEDKLEFKQYIKFLSQIDIAIFAHDRQQAFGNIITLLGLNKTVYIKYKPMHKFFRRKGIKIKNINLLSNKVKKHNNNIKIKKYFSKYTLINQLKNIFQG